MTTFKTPGKLMRTTDRLPPTVPASLTVVNVVPTISALDISWQPSTDNIAVAGYKLFRDGSEIIDTPSTSFSDTGLTQSTMYSYTVLAYDASGNSSAQSLPTTASTTDGQAPSIPLNVNVVVGTDPQTELDISWDASTDNIGVVGYKIFRDGSEVGDVPGLSFTDTGLVTTQTYSYTIEAYDNVPNISGPSTPVNGTTIDITAPSIPTNLSGSQTTSSVDLSWSASTDNVAVTGYKLFRDGFEIMDADQLAFTDSGLNDNTSYLYSIKAYDAANNESNTDSINVLTLDGTAPSVPTGMTVAQNATTPASQLDIAWLASTDNVGVTGYKLFRDGFEIMDADQLAFTDTGLLDASAYTYTALAYDTAGNESSLSIGVSGNTKDSIPPTIPGNLIVSQGTPTGSALDISWSASTDNVGVTGYKLFRDGTLILNADQLSFTDTGLNDAVAYQYTVLAYDADLNESAQSSPTQGVPTDITPPSIPANLNGFGVGFNKEIDISWSASTDNTAVTGYKIFRDGSEVGDVAGLNFVDNVPTAETNYTYTVLAYDAAGNESSQSSPIVINSEKQAVAIVTRAPEQTPFNPILLRSVATVAFSYDPGDGTSVSIGTGQRDTSIEPKGTMVVKIYDNATTPGSLSAISFRLNRVGTLKVDATNLDASNGLTSLCNDGSYLTDFDIVGTSHITQLSDSWNGCSSLTSFPQADWSSMLYWSNTWADCSSLTAIPPLDFLSTLQISGIFLNCSSLALGPQIFAPNCTIFNNVFNGCSAITSTGDIYTPNGEQFSRMFTACSLLTCIPRIDTLDQTVTTQMFNGCFELVAPDAAEQTQIANGFNYTNPGACP